MLQEAVGSDWRLKGSLDNRLEPEAERDDRAIDPQKRKERDGRSSSRDEKWGVEAGKKT